MMEVLVFIDGVDAMTSKAMQARRSYQPSEMVMNEQVCLAAAPGAKREQYRHLQLWEWRSGVVLWSHHALSLTLL